MLSLDLLDKVAKRLDFHPTAIIFLDFFDKDQASLNITRLHSTHSTSWPNGSIFSSIFCRVKNRVKNRVVWPGPYKDVPVTVEQFVPGEFRKYVNNDGQCCFLNEESKDEILNKAEYLAHFSYVDSNGKLMLLDLHGSDYILYDPEIATKELLDGKNESEAA